MNVLLYAICILLINALEQYVLSQYIHIFFASESHNHRLTIFAYVLRCFLPPIINRLVPILFVNLLVFFTSTLLVTLTYRGSLLKKFLVTLFIECCGILAELLLALLIGIDDQSLLGDTQEAGLILSLSLCLFTWCPTIFIRRFRNLGNNALLPAGLLMAVLLVPLITILNVVFLLHQPNHDRTFVFLFLSGSLICNFSVMYLFDSMSRVFQELAQEKLLKQKRNYYDEQSKLLQNAQLSLSAMRHDLNNHVTALNILLQKQDYQSIDAYVDALTETLSSTRQYSNSGNVLVDGIINLKLMEAANEGISVSCQVTIPVSLPFQDVDLNVILSNLLDNAIEAARKAPREPFVKLMLHYTAGALFLTVTNNYSEPIRFSAGHPITTKKDKTLHGIGIRSVKMAAKKYNGSVEFTPDEASKTFSVSVTLYQPNDSISFPALHD